MKPEVRYGDKILTSRYLDPADILDRPSSDGIHEDPASLFTERFEKQLGRSDLIDLIKDRENIAIVINDRNRPTPTHLVLSYFMGVDGMIRKIKKVHVATGTHKEPSEEDLRAIMGDAYEVLRDRIHIHVAKDEAGHISYGKTTRGTPLLFDKELEGNDLYIFVNSVEPHYFAGFTGGRKSIIPGMAYFGTVEQNHSNALSSGSRALGLEGNPVHEDMVEAAKIFLHGKDHLSIQIVQGPGKVITDVKVGNIFRSFDEAVESAVEQFCIPVENRYDIVVTVARSPMDRTLYQAQKAIENGKLALKDGGVLILVAKCSEGIGQSAFWDLLTMSDDPEKILMTIDQGYVLGYHKAAKIVQLARSSGIFAVSEIPSSELERGFIKGFSELETALAEALKITGDGSRILLIPDGTVTVPLIKEG